MVILQASYLSYNIIELVEKSEKGEITINQFLISKLTLTKIYTCHVEHVLQNYTCRWRKNYKREFIIIK